MLDSAELSALGAPWCLIGPSVSMATGGGVEVAVVRAVGASVEHAEVDEHVFVGQRGAELRRRDGTEHRLDFAFNVGHWDCVRGQRTVMVATMP